MNTTTKQNPNDTPKAGQQGQPDGNALGGDKAQQEDSRQQQQEQAAPGKNQHDPAKPQQPAENQQGRQSGRQV